MHVLIAGGTGFIGLGLARHLADHGHAVTILTRQRDVDLDTAAVLRWDGRHLGDWQHALNDVDAVVNLCGRSVDCRKTPANRAEIMDSRVQPTVALGAAIAACAKPPAVWIQMSTAHIYGDPEHPVDEDSPIGTGLAPEVGQAWEGACLAAETPHTRKVLLRTSFVLGRAGGALTRLRRLTQWGLGGTIGRGTQGISWIHQVDFNRLVEAALIDTNWAGVYNATAPQPLANQAFMRALRRALRVPFGLPGPGPLVRLAARWPLRTDPELALLGRFCHSNRLSPRRFEFTFPDIASALGDLMRRGQRRGARGTTDARVA